MSTETLSLKAIKVWECDWPSDVTFFSTSWTTFKPYYKLQKLLYTITRDELHAEVAMGIMEDSSMLYSMVFRYRIDPLTRSCVCFCCPWRVEMLEQVAFPALDCYVDNAGRLRVLYDQSLCERQGRLAFDELSDAGLLIALRDIRRWFCRISWSTPIALNNSIRHDGLHWASWLTWLTGIEYCWDWGQYRCPPLQ